MRTSCIRWAHLLVCTKYVPVRVYALVCNHIRNSLNPYKLPQLSKDTHILVRYKIYIGVGWLVYFGGYRALWGWGAKIEFWVGFNSGKINISLEIFWKRVKHPQAIIIRLICIYTESVEKVMRLRHITKYVPNFCNWL